ncbi:hypothetical protein LAZ67_16002354 [Cordylochernes scorpioides]|uniref:Transposase n=1 Tax=Cordylochernes scorpioides TaxID=51811 RepID=A0ABY6LBY5_9ARAC|nr:hypothetical protein LAZ67_16002354 [Cordylochernes scorpioides]
MIIMESFGLFLVCYRDNGLTINFPHRVDVFKSNNLTDTDQMFFGRCFCMDFKLDRRFYFLTSLFALRIKNGEIFLKEQSSFKMFQKMMLYQYASMCQDVFTLDELHQAMNTFFPVSTSGLMRQFWTEKKLSSQPLMDYYLNKLKLANILNISSEQTLEALFSNVNAKLRPFLIAANPANLDMWIKIASSLEEGFRHEETSSPFNGPRYRRDFQNVDSRNATPSQGSLPSGARPGREVGDRQETRRKQFYQDFRDSTQEGSIDGDSVLQVAQSPTAFWFDTCPVATESTVNREVAENLNISIGSCHSIFINDLGMRRVAAKFVQKLLNCDQKQHRMNIANEMLDSVRDDPNLLQRVITGDEAWVYGYDVETKAQSSQWKLPHELRPKKARQVRSNVKVLLTVFFDCRGVVHHEFLPQGRTVNKEYYLQVMRNLREAIR